MNLVGGYGSDGSEDSDGSDAEAAPASAGRTVQTASASASREQAAAGGSGSKRKVVDFSKLPVKRPLLSDVLSTSGKDAEEAPLKKAAELENLLSGAGRSLLSALPPPKATLGMDAESGGVRIDISSIREEREGKKIKKSTDVFHFEGSVMRGNDAPDIEETQGVPDNVMNHPMFSNGSAMEGGEAPTAEELYKMRNIKAFTKIAQDELKDPNWYINNQISGGLGLHAGKKVAVEASMYEAKTWQETTHANPTRNQKRKHQINWLANEAMEKEAELLDRAASSRLTKAQTSMKYGW